MFQIAAAITEKTVFLGPAKWHSLIDGTSSRDLLGQTDTVGERQPHNTCITSFPKFVSDSLLNFIELALKILSQLIWEQQFRSTGLLLQLEIAI